MLRKYGCAVLTVNDFANKDKIYLCTVCTKVFLLNRIAAVELLKDHKSTKLSTWYDD